ncbi:MAG: hypothetical protein AAF404_14535 [Pseudomonadota bacterium]
MSTLINKLALYSTLCIFLTIGTSAYSYATTPAEGCSYRDAALNNGWGYDHSTRQSCPPINLNSSNRLVLNLKGTATGTERSYDTDADGINDTTAICFDAPIEDPATGAQIGTGSDCLDVVSNDGGNIQLVGTGFFELDGGMLVVQGQTTVRPVLQPTVRDGITFTHVSGANGDAGLMYGTGIYDNTSGKVRLSGLVDMSRVESDSIIYFDCIFIVEFN